MLCEVLCAEGTRRQYVSGSFGSHLVFHYSQSAVNLLLLCFHRDTRSHQCRGCEEGSTGVVCLVRLVCLGIAVGYSTVLAMSDAVHASHAAAMVDGVVRAVDTCCLAFPATLSAAVTLGCVYTYFIYREA